MAGAPVCAVIRHACTLTPACRLKPVFDAASKACLAEVDAVTLVDISGPAPARRGRAAVPMSWSKAAQAAPGVRRRRVGGAA